MVRNSGHGQSTTQMGVLRGGEGTREVNGAIVVSVDLVDHVLQLRLAGVLAQRAHDGAQFFGGDLACGTALSVTCVSGQRL